MKLLRVLLISGAILVGLLAIVVILALTPSVQTWAARRALAGQPDMKVQLGRVDVGLQKSTISQLRIERSGDEVFMSVARAGEALRPAGGSFKLKLQDPVLLISFLSRHLLQKSLKISLRKKMILEDLKNIQVKKPM